MQTRFHRPGEESWFDAHELWDPGPVMEPLKALVSSPVKWENSNSKGCCEESMEYSM